MIILKCSVVLCQSFTTGNPDGMGENIFDIYCHSYFTSVGEWMCT